MICRFFIPCRCFAAGLLVFLSLSMIIPGRVRGETPEEINSDTTLLVIDVQEFYFPGGAMPLADPEAAALNCRRLLDKFRSENKRIVHVGHKIKTPSAFHPQVIPQCEEKIIMKSEINAFNGTELLAYLQEHDVKRLVICGMQTHMCVEAAVRAAYDLGFECVLVSDACATRDLTYAGTTIDAGGVHHCTLSSLSGTYAKVVDTDTFLSGE
ncbi:MAG: cysteine hydrolase family protein [Candidatus Latescibacterota bacterium]